MWREPSCTGGGNVNWCHHYRKQHGVSSKIQENQKKYDPAVLLVDTGVHVCMYVVIPQGSEKQTMKRHVYFHVHCASSAHSSYDVGTPRCPSTDEQDKEEVVNVCTGGLLSHEKDILHLQQPGRISRALCLVNKPEKDKYSMVSLIHRI